MWTGNIFSIKNKWRCKSSSSDGTLYLSQTTERKCFMYIFTLKVNLPADKVSKIIHESKSEVFQLRQNNDNFNSPVLNFDFLQFQAFSYFLIWYSDVELQVWPCTSIFRSLFLKSLTCFHILTLIIPVTKSEFKLKTLHSSLTFSRILTFVLRIPELCPVWTSQQNLVLCLTNEQGH